MTPIPAVVTVDTSEDVETALRRCISSGHTRLLVTEDENQDRVRGIVHSNTLARQLMAEGPNARDRAARPRRPDRARDQAARRPARRPPAPALLDGRRDRRVRPRRRDRDGRGHRRGGRGRDRRRDRPRRRRGPAAGERRLVRPRPRRGDRPRSTTGSSCPSTPTPTTRSAASSSPSWADCPSAATRSRPTATRSASSRCARTGSRRCGSASAARCPSRARPSSRRGERGAPNRDRPEDAARIPRGLRWSPQTSSWGGGVTRRRWDAAGVTRERWIGVVHHQAGRPVRRSGPAVPSSVCAAGRPVALKRSARSRRAGRLLLGGGALARYVRRADCLPASSSAHKSLVILRSGVGVITLVGGRRPVGSRPRRGGMRPRSADGRRGPDGTARRRPDR